MEDIRKKLWLPSHVTMDIPELVTAQGPVSFQDPGIVRLQHAQVLKTKVDLL